MNIKIHCSHTRLEDVDLLIPHPRNANRHPKKQIEYLAKIIKHQGFRHPITISKRSGFIVAGHGRLEAAKLLDLKEVPIDEQDFENEAQEFAHLIADNKIAEFAEHDDKFVLEQLKDFPDIDLELLAMPDLQIEEVKHLIDPLEEIKDESLKHILEVNFTNEQDMIEVYDDLLSRGFVVRCK